MGAATWKERADYWKEMYLKKEETLKEVRRENDALRETLRLLREVVEAGKKAGLI